MWNSKASRDMFWAVFYKDYHNKAFSPSFAYRAMAAAYNKTVKQIRAHTAASGLIDNFNERLAAKIQAANEDNSQECFEELDRQVREMVDALAWAVFHEIYGEGGHGWPSAERAEQILKWRKHSAPGEDQGRAMAAQAPKKGRKMEHIDKYYTMAEVAEILRVSRRTVYTWRDTGKLEAVKIGRGLRVSQTELSRVLTGGIDIPAPIPGSQDKKGGDEE